MIHVTLDMLFALLLSTFAIVCRFVLVVCFLNRLTVLSLFVLFRDEFAQIILLISFRSITVLFTLNFPVKCKVTKLSLETAHSLTKLLAELGQTPVLKL